MKKPYISVAVIASLVALGLMLASCGQVAAPAATAKTIPVNLSFPSINPGLATALSNLSAGATKTSSSKAMMLLDRYSITVNDTTTGVWTYPADVTVASPSPGGGNSTLTTVSLVAGDSYTITVNGYNTGLSSWSYAVSGSSSFTIPAGSMSYDVYITLAPYNAIYTNAYSNSNIGEDYWYRGSDYLADGYRLRTSSYTGYGSSGTFTVIGGERWYHLAVPYGNTVTFSIDPQAYGYNDPNAYVFAGLFDENGGQLGGYALSPTFTGSGLSSKVTISTGLTPGKAVYLGYILIEGNGVPIGGSSYDSVVVNCDTQALTDDSFEYNYGSENDDINNPSYAGDLSPTSPLVIDAKAYDPDWYYFYVSTGANYTFNFTEVDFIASGEIGVVDYYNNIQQDSSSFWVNQSGTIGGSKYFTTYLYPGYYKVGVDVMGNNAAMYFPQVGGTYNLAISLSN